MHLTQSNHSMRLRFEEKVKKVPSGCHEWLAQIRPDGYGAFDVRGKTTLAHRAAALLYVEGFTEDLTVMHTCDNRRCVNPAHLRLGTQLENIADRVSKDRCARGESHGNARLSDDEVQRIRELHSLGGWTQVALGRHYGVTSQYVGRLLKGAKRAKPSNIKE